MESEDIAGVEWLVSQQKIEMAKTATAPGPKDLAAQIERDINFGRISPGSWLKQIDLENSYGVSRLAVRQALERLAERGQVELFPNRGYRVKPFDPHRFNNIIGMRAILEVAAAEMVIDRITGEDLARMSAAAEAFAVAVADGTADEREEANRTFHREMLRSCPNEDMIELIFDLRDRIPISVRREKHSVAMLQRSVEEHFQMIELLRGRDAPELAALVKKHILGSLLPELKVSP